MNIDFQASLATNPDHSQLKAEPYQPANITEKLIVNEFCSMARAAGMHVRRSVLGEISQPCNIKSSLDEHFHKSLAARGVSRPEENIEDFRGRINRLLYHICSRIQMYDPSLTFLVLKQEAEAVFDISPLQESNLEKAKYKSECYLQHCISLLQGYEPDATQDSLERELNSI